MEKDKALNVEDVEEEAKDKSKHFKEKELRVKVSNKVQFLTLLSPVANEKEDLKAARINQNQERNYN